MALYPTFHACLQDMDFGEIVDDRFPGKPLTCVEDELLNSGGPAAFRCEALMFMPKDGMSGELFVVVPSELQEVVKFYMAGIAQERSAKEALMKALKQATDSN